MSDTNRGDSSPVSLMGGNRGTERPCQVPLNKGTGGSLIDPDLSGRSAFYQPLLGDRAHLFQDCQNEGGQGVGLASRWAGA